MDRVPPTLNRIPLRLPVLLLTLLALLLSAAPAMADHDGNLPQDYDDPLQSEEIFLNTLNEGFTNAGASVDAGEYNDCEGAPIGHVVNFGFDVGERGEITITAQGTSDPDSPDPLDTVISLVRPDGSRIACNDDGTGFVGSSRIFTVLDPGQYFLEVGGYDGAAGPDYGSFSVNLGFTAGTDEDGDGSRTPADCNDSNGGIKPGAPDVPHNGVDEDCQGGDDRDADNDGFDRGPDCNDGNPGVRPGAREIPGDFEDENCDGRSPAARLGPSPNTELRRVAFANRARVRGLVVTRVRRGLRIVVSCRGGGCPRTQRRTARSSKPQSFRAYRGRTLRRGAVVTVFVYRPRSNFIGEFFRFQVRSGTVRRSEGCLRPGTARRGRCRG